MPTFTIRALKTLLPLLACWLWATCVYGQAAQEVFGKNRIQYRTFDWKYVSSTNFDVYYYNDSIAMARRVARYAESEFARISSLMAFTPYNKIRLYIYTTRAHMLQSNVGLEADNNTIGGRTNFAKSLVEIAYSGSQVTFKEQIGEGIASKLAYDMMYGGSLKEMVQSSYLLLLPDWFMGGIVRYASQGWSQSMDNSLRTQFANETIRQPSNLLGEQAALVGQSIWNYIAQRYGASAVSNVLNQTRLQRDEEESILISLGLPYGKFIREWRAWYATAATSYLSQAQRLPEANVVTRLGRNQVCNQLVTTPDGSALAWTEIENGAYKVKLKLNGKTHTILRGGYKVLNQTPDLQTPVLAWQGNEVLHVLRPHRGIMEWVRINAHTRKHETTQLPSVQQVNSLAIRADAKGLHLLLSVDHDTKTDLAILTPGKEKLQYLTQDLYDDLDASYEGDTAILFASNRPSDTLVVGLGNQDQIANSFDLWRYSLRTGKMHRLTQTWYNERQPQAMIGNLYCLADKNGISALTQVFRNGTQATLTDYGLDLDHFSLAPKAQTWVANVHNGSTTSLYTMPPIGGLSPIVPQNTQRQQQMATKLTYAARSVVGKVQAADETPAVVAPGPATKPISSRFKLLKSDTLGAGDIDIRNYVFESEKLSRPAPAEVTDGGLVAKKGRRKAQDEVAAVSSRMQLDDKATAFGPFEYRNRMNMTSVVTSLEVHPIAGAGFHLQSNMTDLFENHKLYGGGTLFTNFISNFIFGEYQYLKHRVDFKLRFDRRLLANEAQTFSDRYVLEKLTASAVYPISIKGSFSGSAFLAQTRYTQLGTAANLAAADVVVPYTGLRGEYVYDNTQSIGLNMMTGTRIKASAEYYAGAKESGRSFGNLALDVRHYQQIYNEVVLALRGSYGSSVGPAAKQFLLGGMDNWLFNQAQRTGILDETQGNRDGKTDWLFTQFATNMRGFQYNTMGGTSYLIMNAELRVPIVRAFYRGPIASNFMRHLQLTAFSDVGSAWTGGNPFTTNNNINTRYLSNGPFSIKVVNYDSPFLYSYGLGARTMFLGYYVKLDVARGVQNSTAQPLQYYVTLGYDF